MPDKLESHITFNTLIHNIVGPGRIDGMRITPGIIIEEVVDADTRSEEHRLNSSHIL